MATKTITWPNGTGNVTVDYTGQGNGTITVTSDSNNLYENRSLQITVETTDGSGISRTLTIQQAANVRIDISTAIVTAASQTYSGSALTPAPTVTLNGATVPSSGYDVAYSDNTNAGTATITVTGKDDYTGTATGTFTIAKANPTYTAPVANSLTYNGNSRYLTTTGSTSDGTIQYSENGSSWSTTRVTKTTAGTYTTYWRLVGDSNHNDVESTSISTTINKASRTISFGNTYYVQNTSTTTTRTATPSAGSSDGAITYSISSTTYATINSSSGAVTSKTSDGSATVTATIAEGTNYLSASGSYTLYVFATTHDYDYNGSYRSVTLPPGTYQFQCWGAQGGSNAAYSSYGITAKPGGKGGYSIGQLTVSQATAVRVYVGGQGSSSAGGFNGGGSTTGTSQYNASNELGYSKMGGGGGATDIRLSDGSLYSRMIVAGGGGGGAMCYKAISSTTSTSIDGSTIQSIGAYINTTVWVTSSTMYGGFIDVSAYQGGTCVMTKNTDSLNYAFLTSTSHTDGTTPSWATGYSELVKSTSSSVTVTIPSNATVLYVHLENPPKNRVYYPTTTTLSKTTTTTSTDSQNGYYGGGTEGGGYSSAYQGKQDSAGTNGSFGQGANQSNTSYRYCSAAGGGGWYGGGGGNINLDTMSYVKRSGGGSGWVNTSASAGNRPSGYTGLELDSGTIYAGNTSFPSTGGGTETGHSGNGYAKITRLS